MTYDPNGRYEPVDRTGYGMWAILGLIALFVVVGFIYWGASNGSNETATAPVTRTETTGMGGSATPARPTPAPAPTTPAAPAAPAR
jgi:hypothetical protein